MSKFCVFLGVLVQNYGAFFDKVGAGITGPVRLQRSANGTTIDLASQRWTYQVNRYFSKKKNTLNCA